MKIKKYNENDFGRVKDFLTNCYLENKNMTCWLPERFEDLIYRIDILYSVERGKLRSQDYIYIWEEDEEIVGVILPDGDSCNTSIKNGYEYIFPEMIGIAEEKLKPLFDKKENGKIDFLVVSHDSLKYQAEELLKRGYIKDKDEDYDNCQSPMKSNIKIILPNGFKQVYGEKLSEHKKGKACHLGFHSEDEDNDLNSKFREGMESYHSRKLAPMYKDSFESLVITDDGDICSYSFCYVDKVTKTAFIEPVSTRAKYRRMGIGKAMLQGIIKRLKEENIEMCYVNSYSEWRKKFYNSAGFETIDSIGFWYKEI